MTEGGLLGGTFRRVTSSAGDDDVDPVYLPAGQGFVFSSNRQAKSHRQPGAGPHLLRARRVRARARVQPAHDGGRRQQHHADLVQPEPRPQPRGARRRHHHVLALGPRRGAQPLQDLHGEAGRHRHVRALWRAQRGQLLPAPARHGPERQVPRLARLRRDATAAHVRRRRADGDRRRALLRAEHAGDPGRPRQRWPDPGDAGPAQHRPRPVDVRPRHHAVPAVGQDRPRAGRLPPVRGHEGRRDRLLRDAHRRRAGARLRPEPLASASRRPTRSRTTCRRRTRSTCSTSRPRPG